MALGSKAVDEAEGMFTGNLRGDGGLVLGKLFSLEDDASAGVSDCELDAACYSANVTARLRAALDSGFDGVVQFNYITGSEGEGEAVVATGTNEEFLRATGGLRRAGNFC